MIIERQGAIYILLCKLWNIIHHSTSCLRREQSIACFRQSGNHWNALASTVGNGWLAFKRVGHQFHVMVFWRFQCYTSVCRMANWHLIDNYFSVAWADRTVTFDTSWMLICSWFKATNMSISLGSSLFSRCSLTFTTANASNTWNSACSRWRIIRLRLSWCHGWLRCMRCHEGPNIPQQAYV